MGGGENYAEGVAATVTGGFDNLASGDGSSIAAGEFNVTGDLDSFIGAGCDNLTGTGTVPSNNCDRGGEAILGGARVQLSVQDGTVP